MSSMRDRAVLVTGGSSAVGAAAAAVWLCSDEASSVTGHSMIVDGGMPAATP